MLWTLLAVMQISAVEIVTNHPRGVLYTRTDIESACGEHLIQMQFRNEWPRGIRGRVTFFKIDGRDVASAAADLQQRAANRSISTIEIMNCGVDERNPVFQGVMVLATLESEQRDLPPRAFFRIGRQDGIWRLSWD